MLYKIKDKYYVRVGRRFINVDVSIKDDNVNIIPHKPKETIEDSNVEYNIQEIDDDFKKKLMKNIDSTDTKIYR